MRAFERSISGAMAFVLSQTEPLRVSQGTCAGRLSRWCASSIDISHLAPDQSPDNRNGNPIIRQTKFQNENIIPLGKPVLLSSADEVDGTRRLQIEVTATKVR